MPPFFDIQYADLITFITIDRANAKAVLSCWTLVSLGRTKGLFDGFRYIRDPQTFLSTQNARAIKLELKCAAILHKFWSNQPKSN